VTVAIALGSNLGDREAHLRSACLALHALLSQIRVSSFLETDPVGTPGTQGKFLNGAVVGDTAMTPRGLLDALQSIERRAGRARPYPNAPRTLDLDLILFGDLVLSEPGLVVPHPRFRDRGFVLEPLAEIAPDLRDPVTGKTMRELLALLA
jgi:2-amino-4-hydroxy-6-hydroxymethyldihydropteridine diphosphokinase